MAHTEFGGLAGFETIGDSRQSGFHPSGVLRVQQVEEAVPSQMVRGKS